jgi:serine/threonine protein kinase
MFRSKTESIGVISDDIRKCYHLTKKIGKGAFGKVRIAKRIKAQESPLCQENYAVKTIKFTSLKSDHER